MSNHCSICGHSVKFPYQVSLPEQEFSNLTRKVVNTLKSLLRTQEFTNGGTIEERRRRYDERSNPLMLFISQQYDETGSGFTPLREFGNNFNRFLRDKKLRQLTIKKVGMLLRDEGFDISTRKYQSDGDELESSKSIIGLTYKNDVLDIGKNGGLSGIKELGYAEKGIEGCQNTTQTTENVYTEDIQNDKKIDGVYCGKEFINDVGSVLCGQLDATGNRFICPDCRTKGSLQA